MPLLSKSLHLQKRHNCVFFVTMLHELERCPLVSNVIRSAAIFDPTVMVSLRKTILIKRMKTLSMEMMESKIMSSTDCDKTTTEFNGLI